MIPALVTALRFECAAGAAAAALASIIGTYGQAAAAARRVAETEGVLARLVEMVPHPVNFTGAAMALAQVTAYLPQVMADNDSAVAALASVLTTHKLVDWPMAVNSALIALILVMRQNQAVAARLLRSVLPALVLRATDPRSLFGSRDAATRALAELARADSARVAAAVATRLTDPAAEVRDRAAAVLKRLGLSDGAILKLSTSAAAAEVAELRAGVAELEAIPVNVQAAIVDLAAAVRGVKRQRRDG